MANRGDMSDPLWLPAPMSLSLPAAETHIWRIRLDLPEDRRQETAACLSEAERQRAARFVTPELRQRYVVAHGRLRQILGGYLHTEPSSLEFDSGPKGKPCLCHAEPAPGTEGPAGLRFNLSHSAGIALIAVTCGREVGVDVERLRPGIDTESLARRFFSEAEAQAVLSCRPKQRADVFFKIWTRKEAYIKARGAGLSLPLDSFTVDPRLPINQVEEFAIIELDPGQGYYGAVAIEGELCSLRLYAG